ncbi:hypothetical protein SLEP1_g43959 [Rubroshorea leprosula]|uniref:Uncharacterized protein n=1 Tax=Rubroshorea leprosula TaxID=152421 RepID=A0AAV5LFA9_9ROSI|nr:hypothetical protein SLEP1_g43959 [Rubroshorea leprosula]
MRHSLKCDVDGRVIVITTRKGSKESLVNPLVLK